MTSYMSYYSYIGCTSWVGFPSLATKRVQVPGRGEFEELQFLPSRLMLMVLRTVAQKASWNHLSTFKEQSGCSLCQLPHLTKRASSQRCPGIDQRRWCFSVTNHLCQTPSLPQGYQHGVSSDWWLEFRGAASEHQLNNVPYSWPFS